VGTRGERSREEEKTLLSMANKALEGETELEVPAIVSRVVQTGGGQPLDDHARAFMEQCFGFDFSRVRIHTGAEAANAARAVNAHAYTVGHHIVFSAGQYAPDTLDGRRLLAHELTHVAQAQRARVAAPETGVSKSSDASEKEAACNSTVAAAGARAEVAAPPAAAVQRQPQQTGNPPPATPIQPQSQTSNLPPDPNAPQMPPETQRQLLYAATVLSHVPAMPKDQEAQLDQAIGGSELYRLITERNDKRKELEGLKTHSPGPEGSDIYGADIERLAKEVEDLNQRIEAEKARLNMSVDEEGLVMLVTEQFPKMFMERGKQIAIEELNQNKRIVEQEVQRYGLNACVDPSARQGLRSAAQDLISRDNKIQEVKNQLETARSGVDAPSGGIPDPSQMSSSAHDVQRLSDQLAQLDTERNEKWQAYTLQYPILFQTDIDLNTIASGNDQQLEAALGGKLQQILDDIGQTKDNIGGVLKVWNLTNIVEMTSQDLGIGANPVLQSVVNDHIRREKTDEAILKMALSALAVTAGVIAIVATGGAALAAGAVGLGAAGYQAAQSVQSYLAESAATNVALDPRIAEISKNQPDLFWVVLDIVTVVTDAGLVVKAFNDLILPLREVEAMGDILKFETAVRSTTGLPPAAADRVIADASGRRLAKVAAIPEHAGGFLERGVLDTTTSENYLVRVGPPGSYGDHLFSSLPEAEKYGRQLANVGQAGIRETSALARVWPGGAQGNPVDAVRIFRVPRDTPYVQGVVGPQLEGGAVGPLPKIYSGGGPQVVIDKSLLGDLVMEIPVSRP
jgi:hypothetical protein